MVEVSHNLIANANPDELDTLISSSIYRDEMACKMLLAKLDNYLEFANRYGKDFVSCEKPYWIQDALGLGSPVIRFVGLNTVLFSDKHDAKGRLALGQNQYILPRCDDVEYVVLLHHPLDWLGDCQRARDYLGSRARIWLMGHEHTLRAQDAETKGFERLEVYAGATNPPTEDGYEYRYNWLVLSVRTVNDGRQLAVSFWPRIWDPSTTRFIADTSYPEGQEYRDFYLSLARAESQSAEEVTESLVTSSPVGPFMEGASLPENEHYVTRDDKDFRRLQFLFWKKLDRNQRVHVLAELGMLPDDSQLQPIWIRRGLDAARHQGKLRELWDSVMSRLPTDQREPNPFSS
jgi:hypothetical protein